MASNASSSSPDVPNARALSPNRALRIAESFSRMGIYALQGQTQDQPGPRKNVPMAVSNEAVTRNQLMIQNDKGRRESQRWKRPALFDSQAAKSIATPMSTVGASTAQTANTIKRTISASATTEKIWSRLRRSRDHRPSASMLTLKYGMTIRAMTTSVGINTPPTTGGK